MIPPPNFPPIEIEIQDSYESTKWKELEEEVKKKFMDFQAWQEKIEFALEQSGIFIGDVMSNCPTFRNEGSTDGVNMKIISITSLRKSPSVSEVAEEEFLPRENRSVPLVPTNMSLNESDNDMEIGVSGGMSFRPSPNLKRKVAAEFGQQTEFEERNGILNEAHENILSDNRSNSSKHVELPPVDYSGGLLEEETEGIGERKDSFVQERIIAGQVSRRLRSSSIEEGGGLLYSGGKKPAITTKSSSSSSCSSRGEGKGSSVQAEPRRDVLKQKKFRFAKDQEEALNHIDEVVISGKRKFKCRLCEHVETRDTSMVTHIRMSHIGSERKYPCSYCSYRFKKGTHLQKHVQIKHPGQPCDVPASLNIVLRREDDKFNIVKSGSRDKSLTTKRNHTVAFPQRNNSRTNGSLARTQEDLEREIRSSYEIFRDGMRNSYLCIACGFLFDEELMIRQHIIHTHKCAFCPEIFTSSELLESHMSFCSTSGASTSKKIYGLPSAHSITLGPSIQDSEREPPKKRYSFPEEIRHEVDKYVSNIHNPKPPYICNICHLIIKSTRQSARVHVRSQHPDVLTGLE